MRLFKLCILFILISVFLSCTDTSSVSEKVDWKSFMTRHDMIWKKLPTEWSQGPFFGNGLIGSLIWKDGVKNRFRMQVFRSDVQEHRSFEYGHAGYARCRMQIGSFYFEPVGKIEGCDWRLDLYNAELTGTIQTDKGTIRIRHFTHSHDMILYTELETSGDETGCKWTWEPADPWPTRHGFPESEEQIPSVQKRYGSKYPTKVYDRNADPRIEERDGVNVCVQDLTHGGQHSTAWTLKETSNLQQHIICIAKSWPDEPAVSDKDAVHAVRTIANLNNYNKWKQVHYDWWHQYYPKSFISLSDTRAETVYWTQMYKLASASRHNRPMMDTAGLWQVPSSWPFVTWNLNVQLCYWAPFPANRMGVGESLIYNLWKFRQNLINNVMPEEWRDDSAMTSVNSGNDMAQPWGMDNRDFATSLGNLVWALHDVWLQYRYSMDDEMLREKLYPLLRRSVNWMLHHVYEKDGVYHLPPSGSPEYGKAPDCNYDLALLRWGCETLLKINDHLNLNDPLKEKWQDTINHLVPFYIDENGYMVGAGVPFVNAHRHYSHLLMFYPLYLVNPEEPEQKELLLKSLEHWLDTNRKEYERSGNWGVFAAYTHTGASSMYAALRDGEKALEYLNGFIEYPLVRRNSLYAESGPVLESPLSAAQNVHDMLIQSWGAKIRIFPAVPELWPDVIFHNLRSEGGFLVSAERKAGSLQWIRVTSLAGEPCTLLVDFDESFEMQLEGNSRTLNAEQKLIQVDLLKDQTILLKLPGVKPEIHAVSAQTDKLNWYGLK